MTTKDDVVGNTTSCQWSVNTPTIMVGNAKERP